MGPVHRVLLVDDEPRILDALQRVLRPLRATWDITVATSARAAIAELERCSFDVVVSDMRMPETDGAELLAVVKEKSPHTARIILSGQTEKDAALRALPVAHQFLQKPFPPGALLELLLRRARFPLEDLALRQRIGAIVSLPCDPEIARELAALVTEDEMQLDAIAAVVKKEPALVLKLLQLTSSSFFGIKRQSDDVATAVAFAGEDLLRSLADVALDASAIVITAKELDLAAVRAHAAETARLAKVATADSPKAHACFVAGMLHEIGKLVLATYAPDTFDAVARRMKTQGVTFEEAERAEGVVSHSVVGAALLDLWGLPESIVEAVATQNEPAGNGFDAAHSPREAHSRSRDRGPVSDVP